MSNEMQADKSGILVLSLDDILKTIRFEYKKILFSGFIAFAVSALYIMNQPNVYESETLVAPANNAEGSNGINLSGGVAEVAKLAGINSLSDGTVTKTEYTLATIKSRKFISHFVEKYKYKAAIMASTGYDNETQKLIYDESLYNEKAGAWNKENNESLEPTDLEVHETIVRNLLKIEQAKNSNFIRISFRHYSPEFAYDFLTNLIRETNQNIQNQDKDNASKTVAYLQEQISKTAIADMQNVFYQMIQKQLNALMLAEVSEDYVLSVLDPPFIPEKKASPKRAIFVLVSTFIVLSITLAVIIFNSSLPSRREPQ